MHLVLKIKINQHQEIAQLLSQNKGGKILITAHHKPDGDALGSALGLKIILENLNHNVDVIMPSDFPSFLNFLPEINKVKVFDANDDIYLNLIKNASIIFALDFNSPDRLKVMEMVFNESSSHKIMIDHHLNPKDFALYSFWSNEFASTCEAVVKLCELNDWQNKIDKKAAECLYTGIITDTGSFRFGSVSSYTHSATALLMNKGFNHAAVHNAIYDSYTLKRLKFMGYLMNQKIELHHKNKVAISTLSKEELKKYGSETGDTEGFVNWGLALSSTELSILIVERDEMIKMSFRSKSTFPCNQLAQEHFSGGGHFNASGGSSTLDINETKNKLIQVISDYEQFL